MDYPLLNVFLTMLWFFLWVMWLALVFRIVADIFRSHDLGGWAKAGWLLCVLLLPFLGVFVYLAVRGRKMSERAIQEAQEHDKAFRTYVQEASAEAAAASANGSASQLAQLAELRRKGELNDQEYQQAKHKVLTS
ncbi:SHOCT domain-containing protein [Streptomyces sp. ODS28]|uniref:SHOCT domain-containing protein n=1 Tax=Streptomyces sp. ODS28 TaxID=3136688 RepID=UPI0031E74DDD